MTLTRNTLGFRLIATAILAAAATSARAQTPTTSDDAARLQHCRKNTSELIFLNREQLRAKCGMWTQTYTVKGVRGDGERMVYSRYFVVTMRKGQVSSVRQRRHIFTGFGKDR